MGENDEVQCKLSLSRSLLPRNLQSGNIINIMNGLDRENEHRDLCKDVTLVAENGKEFKAHMDVLSQASPFFERLFKSTMKESVEGVVRLEILTESQMVEILEFIYTGSIQILTQEKAEELIELADYLCLESLKSVAQTFLEGNLSTSNCISYYYLAEKYMCEELMASSRKFIHLNFTTVAESEEFLKLPSHEVAKWISSEDIAISEEEDVFKILLKWINQARSQRCVKIGELFRHVRLTCMSRDFLVNDVVTNELVKETKECRDSVTGALKWVDRDTDCHVPRPQRPRKALESCVVVVCPVLKPLDFFCYFPVKNDWCRLSGIEYPKEPYVIHIKHVVTYRSQLFAITSDIYESQCYDPDMNRWYPAPWSKRDPNQVLIEKGKTLETVVVVKDEMCFISYFILRGYGTPPSKLCRYNLDSNSICSPLNWINRQHSCVIAFDTYIYAIGGTMLVGNESSVRSEAARFDTVENKWEKIADIQEARFYACGLATHEKIFIAAGVGKDSKQLKTCEVYNMLTDEWQFIASLTAPRNQGNMVLVNGTLYVLGGYRKLHVSSMVECYDQEKDQWNERTFIPAHEGLKYRSFTFKASSLKIFNGSLNVLKVEGASGMEMQN